MPGSPLAGWMIHLVHTTHVSPTNEGYQIHTPACAAGLANKASTGLIWMLDFNVSQPHLCLKMIICHWGKQTDKYRAFLGRVWHSRSCDSGCLPTVAGEHSYMHSGSGIWIFAQWYHSQHIDGDHMCVLDRSPVALSRLCIRYNPCCHCKR